MKMTVTEKNITEKLGEQLSVLNGDRRDELSRIIDMAVLVAGEYEKQREAVETNADAVKA
jgi:hypothetical protein